MSDVVLYALFFCLGVWAGVMHLHRAARKDRAAVRAAERDLQVAVQSSATQHEMRRLQFAFMDYMQARGLAPDEAVEQVFADWLANLLDEAVIVRQVDGPGIAIALPDDADG